MYSSASEEERLPSPVPRDIKKGNSMKRYILQNIVVFVTNFYIQINSTHIMYLSSIIFISLYSSEDEFVDLTQIISTHIIYLSLIIIVRVNTSASEEESLPSPVPRDIKKGNSMKRYILQNIVVFVTNFFTQINSTHIMYLSSIIL